MNSLSFLSIDLNRINDSQRWDIHPFLEPNTPVDSRQPLRKNSIFLQPPLVYEERDGSYEILSGRRRIQTAKEIHRQQKCTCLVAPQATPFRALLSLLFESHCLSSPLSPMELAYFFNIGRSYLPPEELARTFLPNMPEKNSTALVMRYLQLLPLEKEIQQLVHSLFIAETMALDLVKLKPEDRTSLGRLFWDFQLGGGKQRRLFMLLRDVSARYSTTIPAYLKQPEIAEILRHKEMNTPQKTQKLLSLLQQKSAPSYHADEEEFRSQINRLKLPAFCGVQHSQAFETDEVTLTIRFNDMAILINTWPEVNRALQKSKDHNR